MGERSTLALARPLPASGVRAFLDSLDERVAQQDDEDTLGYSSLDADVTEEEESHYLGESTHIVGFADKQALGQSPSWHLCLSMRD